MKAALTDNPNMKLGVVTVQAWALLKTGKVQARVAETNREGQKSFGKCLQWGRAHPKENRPLLFKTGEVQVRVKEQVWQVAS